jgi:hypothetical protein
MRAMAVMRFMGYVNHHVFGMDGCSIGETYHAGDHTNANKKFFDLEYPEGSGKIYRTTPNLLDTAKTVPHEIDMLKLESVTFYGNGLVRAIVENTGRKSHAETNIGFTKPPLISEGYRKELAERHMRCPLYGSDGFRYAGIVRKLVAATDAKSVLDYGCGKGVLAAKLDFPIWEYDPAIPGKTATPRPADLVVCTNVLDDVEPEYLADVLVDLTRCVKKVGYFVMSSGSAEYWRPVLERFFYVGKISEEGDGVVAVVGPIQALQQKPASASVADLPEKQIQAQKTNLEWRYTNDFCGGNMPAMKVAA